MRRLTKLHFDALEGLQDRTDLVSTLVEYISLMTDLEELTLENCLITGYELKRVALAIQEAEFLPKLKYLCFNSNKFDTDESCEEMAKAIAHAPKFQTFNSEKTGVRITCNHTVKVRRTEMFVVSDGPKLTDKKIEEHVIKATPFIEFTRKFD